MTASARPALPRRSPRLRHFTAGLCLAAAALAARADIAVLREKGPHSGSAFSNPGLVADAPAGLKVTMKNADVKIHLRPGDGDTLKADVTANFEMEDSSPAELAGQLYLVGFPVTGLSSKIVTIDQFKVTVDGQEPATVLRQNIYINRRESKRVDQKLSGELDAHFAPETERSWWTLHYSNEAGYPASYLWQQVAQPWPQIHVRGITADPVPPRPSERPPAQIHVRVTYTMTLHPQSIHYSRSYDRAESDGEVIPSKSLSGDKWNDRYYFFDYVLRSGATWDGPIGKEVVELTSDPMLGLSPRKVGLRPRKAPTFFIDEEHEMPERTHPTGTHGTERKEIDSEHRTLRWTLENGDPTEDLLISVPFSAITR